MIPLTNKPGAGGNSNFGKLPLASRLKDAVRSALSDKNSRNLLAFLVLNFTFAFVEFAYGCWTNSLGLISDSFHMFFDCTGLVAGLAAQIVSRWPADDSYAYGYKRAEVLAGFVNALFLLFIAFFILEEAVERAIEPPEVHHERLFLISVLGLLVNLVGIYAFQHGGHGHSHGGGGGGHGHSHGGGGGGGGHGHSHDNHNASTNHSHFDGDNNRRRETNLLLQNSNPQSVAIPMYNNGGNNNVNSWPDDHSSHSHYQTSSDPAKSHLMKGVFLHILADTLGSVGVVVSALLMRAFGWMRADPICSIFIGCLVGLSVIPLLKDSACVLMQRTPVELEEKSLNGAGSSSSVLQQCYRKLRTIRGVYGVQEPRFWTLCSDSYVGCIKLEVNAAEVDARFVVKQAEQIFSQVGVRHLYVQLDYTTLS
ncbi:zinc transporter 7 [Adelges cooleyi]|uniref:zinc transporter 7 n=1 Tax=Adelges cooleyi TaxID=133065 RepID=UPI0021809B18|nr:zinc transporter 7 [Adelges cooleyi]